MMDSQQLHKMAEETVVILNSSYFLHICIYVNLDLTGLKPLASS